MMQAPDRRGSLPRSILILLVVAVVAVGGLWLSGRQRSLDFTLGGALFPVETDQIEGLLLTRQGLQYRFDRLPGGQWSLSGSADDYLDPQAMDALVNVLPRALGGAILPGTETEDRRYDFNGPDAMRLRVFLAGGGDISLSLGAINPVTGNYFASGAGRDGCFPVAAPFRDRLFMLPATVQAKTLLPPLSRDKVQDLWLTRSGNVHRFARRDGHWWLSVPGAELATALRGLPPLVNAYQAMYDDRRRSDADGRWVMADAQAIGQLIYEVSEIIVRDIKSPQDSASRLGQWELVPPWRQVVLQGEGLNPDPGAPVADQYTIAFGTPVGEDLVPALRRGNVLLTDKEAINLLDKGLDVLVEQNALSVLAREADRLRLEREGGLLLDAARTGETDAGEGRLAWETVFPAAGRKDWPESERRGLSQDLIVNLNRIAILAVLPPTSDPAVLEDRERVRLRLVWGEGEQVRELVLESGYLAAENLPAGSDLAPRTPDGGPPVGLWFPASGKLLQIPNQLVVTARSMVPFARPQTSP